MKRIILWSREVDGAVLVWSNVHRWKACVQSRQDFGARGRVVKRETALTIRTRHCLETTLSQDTDDRDTLVHVCPIIQFKCIRSCSELEPERY